MSSVACNEVQEPSSEPVDDYDIQPWEVDDFEDQGDQIEKLSPGWVRKATVEVQEKVEWRERDIEELRKMVQEYPGLHCRTDDAFLLRFLRAQKFDYDRSFKMLERYFLMRKHWPRNFEKVLPSLAKDILEHQQQTVLKHRDPLGRRIFLFRVGNWNPREVSTSDVFAANYLLLELIARESKTQIAGLVMVVDMKGFGFSQVMHVTREYVKSVASIIQNTFPLRFREIHIINESYLFDIVFTLIKPFLSETIRSRITCHGSDLSKFHAKISPDVLPEEFGGKLDEMSNKEIVEVLLKEEEYYKDLMSYGFDENVSEERIKEDTTPHNPLAAYCLGDDPETI